MLLTINEKVLQFRRKRFWYFGKALLMNWFVTYHLSFLLTRILFHACTEQACR